MYFVKIFLLVGGLVERRGQSLPRPFTRGLTVLLYDGPAVVEVVVLCCVVDSFTISTFAAGTEKLNKIFLQVNHSRTVLHGR